MGVSLLGLETPLATVAVCGASVVEYWLTWLAENGARDILISSSDRHQIVAQTVGDGARWGLKVRVSAQPAELTLDEALSRFRPASNVPLDPVYVCDYLPGRQDEPLFLNYGSWFAGVSDWINSALTADRVGIRELKPGVFVSTRAKISPDAELHSPCWVDDGVIVGPRSIVGPYTVLERRAYIESDAEVSTSQVAPNTFVGRYTVVKHSIANSDRLIDWRTGNSTIIQDPFMLCALTRPQPALAS